jgi:hypothetical protein
MKNKHPPIPPPLRDDPCHSKHDKTFGFVLMTLVILIPILTFVGIAIISIFPCIIN